MTKQKKKNTKKKHTKQPPSQKRKTASLFSICIFLLAAFFIGYLMDYIKLNGFSRYTMKDMFLLPFEKFSFYQSFLYLVTGTIVLIGLSIIKDVWKQLKKDLVFWKK